MGKKGMSVKSKMIIQFVFGSIAGILSLTMMIYGILVGLFSNWHDAMFGGLLFIAAIVWLIPVGLLAFAAFVLIGCAIRNYKKEHVTQ